jgi:predicted RNase H-like HicB family nuclease
MSTRTITAAVYREGDGYVAQCLELDVVSQGDTVEQARDNLRESVELFLETASPQEVAERLHGEMYVTPLEVKIG